MIKAENIANKEFRKSLYGYDCEQVDRYLDELIVQLRQMEQERLEMASTIEYLAGQLQGDPVALLQEDEIVTPVSPHQLLSNTGRRRLTENKSESAKPPRPKAEKVRRDTGEQPRVSKTDLPEESVKRNGETQPEPAVDAEEFGVST